ncbi:hypothetical protein Esti_000632 [Eimeria stiedai]
MLAEDLSMLMTKASQGIADMLGPQSFVHSPENSVLEASVTADFEPKASCLVKAPKAPFSAASFVAFFLSLAIVYMLRACFRFLYVGDNMGVASRILADSHAGDDGCPVPEIEGADGPGQPEGRNAHRHEARRSEQQTDNAYLAITEGWGMRKMPLVWRRNTRSALHGIKGMAESCKDLVGTLSPSESFLLALHVTLLATVELAGFSYLPKDLQDLRAVVGSAYSSLAEVVLSMEALHSSEKEGVDLGVLQKARELLVQVCREPPSDELLEAVKYKAKVTKHFSGNKITGSIMKRYLSLLMPWNWEGGGPLVSVGEVVDVAKALLRTRKRHLLNDKVLRRWLGACHKDVSPNFLYSMQEFDVTGRLSPISTQKQMAEISEAVLQVSGSAKLLLSPRKPFFGHPEPSAESPTILPTSSSTQMRPQEPPQLPPPCPFKTSPHTCSGEQDDPPQSSQNVPSAFIAFLNLAHELEQEQVLENSGYYEALGASPRSRTPHGGQAVSLQALGWGPMVIPPPMTAQLVVLMDKLEREALKCIRAMRLLNPRHVVAVAVRLAKLAIVESAGLAPLLPPELQHARDRVGSAYTDLIQSLFSYKPTAMAASKGGSEETLRGLLGLLAKISSVPPRPAPESVEAYMVCVVSSWRLCNFSAKACAGLTSVLLRRGADKLERGSSAQIGLRALEALFETRKKQVLRDSKASEWLCTCHAQVVPNLLFTQREQDQEKCSEKRTTQAQLVELSRVLSKVQNVPPFPKSINTSSSAGRRSSAAGPSTRPQSLAVPVLLQDTMASAAFPRGPAATLPVGHFRGTRQPYPPEPPLPEPIVQLPEIYGRIDPQGYSQATVGSRPLGTPRDLPFSAPRLFESELPSLYPPYPRRLPEVSGGSWDARLPHQGSPQTQWFTPELPGTMTTEEHFFRAQNQSGEQLEGAEGGPELPALTGEFSMWRPFDEGQSDN